MLEKFVGGSVLESAEDNAILEAVSDEAMAQLQAVLLEDTLSETEMSALLEECEKTTGMEPVEERTIVKLDRRAKRNRDYKLSILQVAKEMGLPSYKKIITLWEMERYLMDDMEKKCATKAKARMKTMGKKSEKGDSPIKKAISNALTRSERHTKEAMKGKKAPATLKTQTNTVMKSIASKVK